MRKPVDQREKARGTPAFMDAQEVAAGLCALLDFSSAKLGTREGPPVREPARLQGGDREMREEMRWLLHGIQLKLGNLSAAP